MKTLLSIFIAWPLVAAVADNTSRVLSAAGSYTSNTTVHVSCFGQSSIGTSTAKTMINRGGFLGGAILQPLLDTDSDGLPDELDLDNDNDLLTDLDEITGTPWFPARVTTDLNHPDTDMDGASDNDEAIAGTDPTDATHRLFITAIQTIQPSGSIRIEWDARDGKIYTVYRADSLAALPGTPIHTATHLNAAAPPFFSGTESFLDIAPGTNAFYRVEVLP